MLLVIGCLLMFLPPTIFLIFLLHDLINKWLDGDSYAGWLLLYIITVMSGFTILIIELLGRS